MSPVTHSRKTSQIIGWVSIVIGIVLLVAIVNTHRLIGLWREWHYDPPLAIQEIVRNTDMTEKARHIFYQAIPQIDRDRTVFERHCQSQESSKTVELGCYTPDGRIYLLDLGDVELSDVINVTAAHEMLHAAYAQTGIGQKNKLNAWLESEVGLLDSDDLRNELKNYSISEPGQRDNELHSLIGTEYKSLRPELEQYYGTYFGDRSKVLAYNERFNQAFRSLEAEMDNLSVQIDSLKTRMQRLSAQRDYEAYNKLVPTVNALIVKYNGDVTHYNKLSRTLRGEQSSLPAQ